MAERSVAPTGSEMRRRPAQSHRLVQLMGLASLVALGSCSEGVSEPPPPAPADVQAVSLELLPGNLLVGEAAIVETSVANLGGSPSGPVNWQVRVGDSVVASGQLAGIGPGETEGIGHPAIGTRDAHWRWQAFTSAESSELMTALFRDHNPLTSLTIGALEDIGYAVDRRRAENYVLSTDAAGPLLDISDDRLLGPLRIVTPDGRTRTVLERW